ncbi:MAG TPA: very short patch repair endonuclease [Sphingomicrobium sp.]
MGKRRKPPMTRSQVMSRIKGIDTSPEWRVRRYLWSRGLRYRLHAKRLPGKPDLVFASRRVAVFVHGCFWHRHPNCPNARMPKSRLDFWGPKLASNAVRDRENATVLERNGWTVLTVWECETVDQRRLDELVSLIRAKAPL